MENHFLIAVCILFIERTGIANGEEYIFAVFKSDDPFSVSMMSWFSEIVESIPVERSMHVTGGIENKSIIMDVNDNATIYLKNDFSSFSPLPVFALGRRYIVHFPDPPDHIVSVLVIATYNQTDVDVRFSLNGNISFNNTIYRDGDTLSLRLEVNQTFTVLSDGGFTGTVVETSEPVAVFCGARNIKDRYEIIAYEQMLPVEHFSDYYAVAVDDHPAGYQLQIISDHKDTQITFNNGSTVSVDQDGVYRQNLLKNQSLSLRTSKPVMTSLYRRSGFESTLVTIPPASALRTRVVLSNTDVVKILTFNKYLDIEILSVNLSDPAGAVNNVSVTWEMIPNSYFWVATMKADLNQKYFISSEITCFTVLMFGPESVRNVGYELADETMCSPQITSTRRMETTDSISSSHGYTRSEVSNITETTSPSPLTTPSSILHDNLKPYTYVFIGILVACVFLVIIVAVILLIQRKRNVGSKGTKHENTLQIQPVENITRDDKSGERDQDVFSHQHPASHDINITHYADVFELMSPEDPISGDLDLSGNDHQNKFQNTESQNIADALYAVVNKTYISTVDDEFAGGRDVTRKGGNSARRPIVPDKTLNPADLYAVINKKESDEIEIFSIVLDGSHD